MERSKKIEIFKFMRDRYSNVAKVCRSDMVSLQKKINPDAVEDRVKLTSAIKVIVKDYNDAIKKRDKYDKRVKEHSAL